MFHYKGYLGFEAIPYLKPLLNSYYESLKIADLNPSEERGIVLIGMEFFKYPRAEE